MTTKFEERDLWVTEPESLTVGQLNAVVRELRERFHTTAVERQEGGRREAFKEGAQILEKLRDRQADPSIRCGATLALHEIRNLSTSGAREAPFVVWTTPNPVTALRNGRVIEIATHRFREDAMKRALSLVPVLEPG